MKFLFLVLFLVILQPAIATEAFNEDELAALEKIKGELPSLFPHVDYSKLAEKLAAEILSLKASLGSK
jgi:hypothetical protein